MTSRQAWDYFGTALGRERLIFWNRRILRGVPMEPDKFLRSRRDHEHVDFVMMTNKIINNVPRIV